MIVWVQFPALKVHFYHKEILTSLGNLLGRTIRLDFHTLNLQRAKFARIAVELDLSKPLVPRIWLDDAWQKVEYENLPDVCFECGKIGHSSVLCPKLQLQTPPSTLAITGGETPVIEAEKGEAEPAPGFGPWMLVSRKTRRNSREPSQKGKPDSVSKIANGSIPAKQGKHESLQKEGGRASPISPQTTPDSPHRAPIQERKGAAGKKQAGEKKGKEPVSAEARVGGKGLLGPIPGSGLPLGNGPKAKADQAQASTSNKSPPKPTAESKPKAQATILPELIPPVENSAAGTERSKVTPPAVQTVTGVNGTIMQIVNLPPIQKEDKETKLAQTPSAKARTKHNKPRKMEPRRTPTKLSPTKGLQIWTPKKERKTKSRARIASLTLQEINAWTNAAKEAPDKLSGGNPVSQAERTMTDTSLAEPDGLTQ
ncbi:unnamed protein product [Linum tenue]|nr:unnamed protein product [Linum tenue]